MHIHVYTCVYMCVGQKKNAFPDALFIQFKAGPFLLSLLLWIESLYEMVVKRRH